MQTLKKCVYKDSGSDSSLTDVFSSVTTNVMVWENSFVSEERIMLRKKYSNVLYFFKIFISYQPLPLLLLVIYFPSELGEGEGFKIRYFFLSLLLIFVFIKY